MRRAALAVSLLLVGGCALFSKGDVTEPRYFAPSPPARDASSSARPEGAAASLKLRIGRVSSGEHLRQRIVFRASPVEVGEYEDFRWTEKPEEYVRRALLRALFEERGITQAVGGRVPTLDLEVLSFEEVRHGSARAARVELSYAVRDERVVIAAHTVTVERPAVAGDDDMAAMVQAMSSALDEVSATIANEVEKSLELHAKASVDSPAEPASSSSETPARRP